MWYPPLVLPCNDFRISYFHIDFLALFAVETQSCPCGPGRHKHPLLSIVSPTSLYTTQSARGALEGRRLNALKVTASVPQNPHLGGAKEKNQ